MSMNAKSVALQKEHQIKLSAIVPNYNSAEFLPRAMQSLLNQSEPFDEIIVVDDGSTDQSIAIIQDFMQSHANIRLIRHETNQGVNPALNTGILNAQGNYVILCAADDVYGSRIVALAKNAIKQHPTIGLVCGDALVHRYDMKAPFYRMLPFEPNQPITADEFKQHTRSTYTGFNSGGGMFIKRQLILDAGLLKLPLRWHGDWLLYFVCAFTHGFYYINDVFIEIYVRKAGYCERGRQVAEVQNQVMLDTVRTIAVEYSELWEDFKAGALSPHYSVQYIPLFLKDSIGRKFFTKKLLWKMFINNKLITRIGRLFPYRFILTMRKKLKA
jgi:glycosyltransferase involved in cell wall biosynthesis